MILQQRTEIPKRHPSEEISNYIDRLRALGIKTPAKRMIKTDEQILGCREAGRINSLVLDAVERELKIGMTTADIDDIVRETTARLGARSATLGFEGFPASVCTSLNGVVCHGIPSKKQKISEGDILNVDCTTVYNGYFGDASRMFTFGEISSEARRLVEVTREALELAVGQIRPYESHLGDIGYTINTHAKKNGFSVVREIGGHGVGLAMHEDPFVAHVGVMGAGMVLLPGMIFTIEPMINLGSPRVYIDRKDGWTVRTLDGSHSAQVEYELLVTERGVEILSK